MLSSQPVWENNFFFITASYFLRLHIKPPGYTKRTSVLFPNFSWSEFSFILKRHVRTGMNVAQFSVENASIMWCFSRLPYHRETGWDYPLKVKFTDIDGVFPLRRSWMRHCVFGFIRISYPWSSLFFPRWTSHVRPDRFSVPRVAVFWLLTTRTWIRLLKRLLLRKKLLFLLATDDCSFRSFSALLPRGWSRVQRSCSSRDVFSSSTCLHCFAHYCYYYYLYSLGAPLPTVFYALFAIIIKIKLFH